MNNKKIRLVRIRNAMSEEYRRYFNWIDCAATRVDPASKTSCYNEESKYNKNKILNFRIKKQYRSIKDFLDCSNPPDGIGDTTKILSKVDREDMKFPKYNNGKELTKKKIKMNLTYYLAQIQIFTYILEKI